MPRGILLIAGLAMVTAIFGQGQTANPSTTTPPVNGPFGRPILVTPSAGFPNPVPTAGISDAGRAGISNATNGIETTNTPSSPETIVTTPSASLPETTNQAPGNELGTSQPTVNDLGTSTFVGGSEESASGTASLAEVSSRYKAEKGTRNAKVLNNEDVQAMLNNKSGVTMAKNMPPLEQNGQATAPQTATQSTQVAQNSQTPASTNQQGQTASGQTGTPPAPVGQSANASTSAENSTTPQINQNQQSNDAQGSRRLPATATLLPLLGLLGLVSGGIGLWFRKLRN
jgi:cobalamin biosynthesis Mg chelatase CobN